MEKEKLHDRYHWLGNLLNSEQNENGFWTGMLSSSALATATAITALKIKGSPDHCQRIQDGLQWLLNHTNADGGFGDTPQSQSNVSTSLLSYAAIYYCGEGNLQAGSVLKKLEEYLLRENIRLHPDVITASVLRFYGKDYTFSIPILSMLVICGVLDEKSCRNIPQLPFELVLLPSAWYSFFNLRVVSYALPALIAMGIFIYKKRTRGNLLMHSIRKRSVEPSLNKLARIIPESGGFLEAAPLTAFVVMCLISSGFSSHRVIRKGIDFLSNQQRSDGSWPIDTDLSTWVTTLTVKALGPDVKLFLPEKKIQLLRNHLLSAQVQVKHPFNQAQPGGWGWTNFSGSVPDVDDTCGAILALLNLYQGTEDETQAILKGCNWLLLQQNKDGGFPTFCRGWGKLPFDSSCCDLTGHAFCALMSTIEKIGSRLSSEQKNEYLSSALKGIAYLKNEQKENSSWLPLWFGNQHTGDKANPVYGTARVCIYLTDCMTYSCINAQMRNYLERLLHPAREYLLTQQNSDGSWGGAHGIAGTMEETSLALSALSSSPKEKTLQGFRWLEEEYQSHNLSSSPIGLYFAALWYDEKLYPPIFYAEALRRNN